MLNFLKQTRKFINSTEPICIVLGNESCDLDSAVCALALAYHYHHRTQQQSTPNQLTTQQFLPVLNIPRRDYKLKTEVRYLFNQHSISEESLTFRDELQEVFVARSKFILVDHHVSPFASRCIEVFDHRVFDEKSQLPSSCEIHLELVGSCATLIAEVLLKSFVSTTSEVLLQYEPLLTMLRSTILLDTVNLSETANRVTPKDVEMCEAFENLLSKLSKGNPPPERKHVFEALVTARADVSDLTALQLLRKDLKILTNPDKSIRVAIPGFPLLVQHFITKPDAAVAVQQFAEETNSSVVLLMGMIVQNGNVERDLGIVDMGVSEICVAIRDKLLTTNDPALCLLQENCCFLNGWFYKMGNIKVTRKHILPLIKQLLDIFENRHSATVCKNNKE